MPVVHYDYYTGEPLDEDLYQQGMADELQAMEQYGVHTVIPISQATGGKHVRGFPIAHMKWTPEGWIVRWRFVAGNKRCNPWVINSFQKRRFVPCHTNDFIFPSHA